MRFRERFLTSCFSFLGGPFRIRTIGRFYLRRLRFRVFNVSGLVISMARFIIFLFSLIFSCWGSGRVISFRLLGFFGD